MDANIREKILTILDKHRIMTVATLRPDGWPQATTVGYVNEGLTLYFLCGLDSQKAKNLALDNRLSLTIDHDTPNLMAITGLSMAARAHAVEDRAEAEKVLRMLPLKYPEAPPLPMKMPNPDEIRLSASPRRSFPCSTTRRDSDTRISSPADRMIPAPCGYPGHVPRLPAQRRQAAPDGMPNRRPALRSISCSVAPRASL